MATSEQEAHLEVSSDMIGECIVINFCEPCTRKHTPSKATVFCKTCNELLCEPCRNSHAIYKSGKHDTVVIENLDSAPVVVMMKGMDKCRDHDKTVKFFCEDHSKLCCNTCAFIHRKCDNVNELASLSSQEGLELEDLNHMLLKLERETCSIIADCNLSEVALSETIANILKQVDEMKDRIIEIFDKANSRMIEEAENFKAEEMKRLGERRKVTSHVNEDIHELLPVSSALVKHGTPQQKYIISHIMKEKIKYIETHITEQRNKHITSTVALNFSKQLSLLLKEEDGIIKLNTERHLTHKDDVQTYSTEIQESSEVKEETTNLNKDCSTDSAQSAPTKPVTMELLVSVDIKRTGFGWFEPLLSGLDFLPDGRLVAVDNTNLKCIIMDYRLQILGTPYKFDTNPYDVVCLSQCELAVPTSGKKVCLLSVSPDNVISLTRQINTSTSVFSICCMTPTTMVVSTYDEQRPVRMITQGGVESDFDRVLFNKKTYKLDESKCTYARSKNTLVLTDRYTHTVFMFDTVKGTSRAVTDENIQEPCGACVGPGDTVLVCSMAKNSIVHLTVDGDILCTYHVDMQLPFTLCMKNDGSRLVVSGCRNGMKKLMMYKLS